jgi:GNAT superfamily N-acetyltransferase
MARGIVVGPANTEADWAGARKCILELFDWIRECTNFDVPQHLSDARQEIADLRTYYAPPCRRLFVGRINGRVVATIGMKLDPDGRAEVRRVWTRRSARGRGISYRLMQRVVKEAEHLGARCLWLRTAPAFMQAAQRLYVRSGFQPVSLYQWPAGAGEVEVLEMERALAGFSREAHETLRYSTASSRSSNSPRKGDGVR